MGGAGIFHNGAFADAVLPSIPAAAQRSLGSTLVHDLFFSRFVLDEHLNLTHWDFVFSTEPGVYVCGHSKHLAATWNERPPAVFHRFRTLQHMHRIHRIATAGTAADRSSDGIMKRTPWNRRTQCSVGEIADALCAAWHNCPSSPHGWTSTTEDQSPLLPAGGRNNSGLTQTPRLRRRERVPKKLLKPNPNPSNY
mmetsp:Transcript_7489/g.23106  ORF Transcript_7489/g.23106 Transcript_7489/m.23106 type:complete len:195 (+) Transcript_7489:449-1033(+)